MIGTYRALRGAVIVLLLTYAPMAAFALFYPYCHVEKEVESVCYVGATNFGQLYKAMCWGLVLASPVVALVIAGFVATFVYVRSAAQGYTGDAA